MNKVKDAYRQLIRSAKIAFKGDDRAYNAFLLKIRSEFRSSSNNLEKDLKKAYQVAHILKHNVVQAMETKPLVYSLKIDPERHELGDNKSRFKGKKVIGDPCGCHKCVEPY